jgi:hypothetical protein
MIPTQPGMFMILEKCGKLWHVTPVLTSETPKLVIDTGSHPQGDSDHNMNLNNTEAVFRWCDPSGFWEWGQETGVRRILVSIPWANYHCWYLGRGELGRAVVLANDYLMVIDVTYGLDNGGALKL